MIESRIDLLFGKGHLPVTVPAGVHPTIIRKGAMQKLSDPSGAIADALARPIGAPALAALAPGATTLGRMLAGTTIVRTLPPSV